MTLHPQAQGLLQMTRESGGKPMSEGTVEDARATMAMIGGMIGAGPEVAEVEDLVIAGDGRDIRARRYRPDGEAGGVVVYTHGGGWLMGTLDDFDAVARRLAVESGCEVVSVDYALAPEHPFPAAPDDAYAATAWIAEHVADGRPLVVVGDSSGGTLAAVTARRARDLGGPEIAMQVLVYPVTDADFSRPSYAEMGDGSYLNSTEDLRWFWEHYLPDEGARRDPDATPMSAGDVAGLPPAVVLVSRYDALHDEGVAYAERLREAGVDVELLEVDDQIHAFWTLVNVFESADHYVAEVGRRIAGAVAARVA
jgi:acetyl esterase